MAREPRMARDLTRARALRVAPVRAALALGERPDPAAGVFETMLVADGVVQMAERHLDRLRASVAELYGTDPGLENAPAPPLPAARARSSARLRVRFVPGEGASVDVGPLGPDPRYSELAPFVLPGGLGRHKWIDRRLLDAIGAAAGPHALPLILDEDMAVLECSWASVLIEERGR